MKFPDVIVSECPVDTTPGSGGPGDVQSLVLKPAVHVACAGELQFSAYLTTGNGGESLIESGVTFTSSSPAVVAIDATTGAATLISAGVASIVATYEGLSATSQVTVMGEGDTCCDETVVATMVMIDDSKSMSLPILNSGARIGYANLIANVLFGAMRFDKDIAGLMRFNTGTILLNAISSTKPIAAVTATTRQTDIEEALDGGLAELDGVTADQKVLVIISDGEHRPQADTAPADTSAILAKAATFRNSGGIIICVGMAASGSGFALLQSIASGGFFLNITDESTAASAPSYLSGFLCYYCGGLPPSYGYCLAEPPSAQLPVSDPLPDTEASSVTTQFTSTKQVCVVCDSTNPSETNLVPLMTDNTSPEGEAFAQGGQGVAVGYEAYKAFDQDADTYCLLVGTVSGIFGYIFTSAQVVTSYLVGTRRNYLQSNPIKWTFDGSNDGTNWTVLDSQTSLAWVAINRLFNIPNTTAYTHYRLRVLQTTGGNASQNCAIATLEMYGMAPLRQCASATRQSYVSQEDADELATIAATAAANALCDVPNNEDTIQFLNGTRVSATPYPSWKLVSDVTGLVTKVTVTLNNVVHRALSAAVLVLEAPDGTAVMILNHTENGLRHAEGVEFIIDDDASTTIPIDTGSGVIPAGTYKPTVTSGRETEQLVGSGPIQPYGVLLSDFIGIDPNGRWKLWAMHRQFYSGYDPLYARLIDGWDLTITTA